MLKIRIWNKINDEMVETPVNNWRKALKSIKYHAEYDDIKINTRASDFINSVKYGYEDEKIKAWLIK